MKYHIEIEEKSDFNLLADFQVQQAIQAMTNMVYPSGVADIINQAMKRERDRNKILQMAQDLFDARENLSADKKIPIVITDSVRNHYADIQIKPSARVTKKNFASSSRPGHYHVVELHNGVPVSCTCEGFFYSQQRTGQGKCRHLREAL